MPSRTAILAIVGVAAIMLVMGMAIGAASFPATKTETTTQLTTVTETQTSIPTITSTSSISASITTTSITSTSSGVAIILPQGATFQVQSSYDCVAGHLAQPFNVTATSYLEGGISASQPGVTVYVSTAQEAQTIVLGHPAEWVYSSGLANSTSFSVLLAPGSYVFWTEGADLNCGATIVTPLEQLTTVTVTEAIMLTPTATTT